MRQSRGYSERLEKSGNKLERRNPLFLILKALLPTNQTIKNYKMETTKLKKVVPMEEGLHVYDGSVSEVNKFEAGKATIICSDGFIKPGMTVKFIGIALTDEVKRESNAIKLRSQTQGTEYKSNIGKRLHQARFSAMVSGRAQSIIATVLLKSGEEKDFRVESYLVPEEWSYEEKNGQYIVRYFDQKVETLSKDEREMDIEL